MIDFASLANELFGFLDNILIDIEELIYCDDNDKEVIEFSNSLYDIYYYIFILIQQENLQGVTLGQFKYPNSFLIYITNTPYSIIIMSCTDKINYNVYTAIKENDILVKFDQLGYKDLYKEQINNNSIIKEINTTINYLKLQML